ncbi:uncharacterized protein DS421_19g643500 [Arachis hypogaea]|uniref:Uncharacterized protein n=1 Tax=Arachis hypogaea TaxID=3818 RepID=A0A6B9V879_ARAHY|nr:uncharacterized protein DS421_19g643500 [Arachis hypogaea]
MKPVANPCFCLCQNRTPPLEGPSSLLLTQMREKEDRGRKGLFPCRATATAVKALVAVVTVGPPPEEVCAAGAQRKPLEVAVTPPGSV